MINRIDMIEIKDDNGVVRVKFSDFSVSYGDPIFVDLSASIISRHGEVNERLRIELSDLEEMKDHSQRLSDNRGKGFYFQHNDSILEIKFASDGSGKIIVSGFLRDKTYSDSLTFEFLTTINELENLAVSCEELIHNLGSSS